MSRGKDSSERVAPAQAFQKELSPGPASSERLNINDLAAVRVSLAADLGRSTMVVREVLELSKGSVVPLDKLAGEAVDLHINGVPFAKGEVVVLGDTVHVRISELVNPKGEFAE